MKQKVNIIILLCLTIVFTLACNEKKEEVANKVTSPKVYSDWIKTDSVSTVYFTHEMDGNTIKAVMGTRNSIQLHIT